VTPWGSRGGPHHVCGVTLCPMWHLVSHILGQLLVYPGNMSVITILGLHETVMYNIKYSCHRSTGIFM